jgi:quercetin dioxygenase-like cupin family protein
MTHIIDKNQLPHGGTAHRFEGHLYDDANVSFFLTDAPPGTGPGLHKHPYEEVFVVQEGEVTFTVGATSSRQRVGR